MFRFPDEPDTLPAQRTKAQSHVRYQDISQDGKLNLWALPHAIGEVVWQHLLVHQPLYRAIQRAGIVPILTRMVMQGGGGPISVRRTMDAEGGFELGHTTDAHGQVDRLLLNTWAKLGSVIGRMHGPPPSGVGEPVQVGRVFAEHVFTRLFAPPGQRKVLRLEVEGLPEVPPTRLAWRPPHALLTVPPGAELFDRELAPDTAPIVFGLGHTDSNQHVNSLVYPKLFEDAVLRRLFHHGQKTTVLGDYAEVAYRKPCFAGERAQIWLQTFLHEGQLCAVGQFVPDHEPGAKPSCCLRLRFATT
jgi:hypothetical protein